MPRLLCSHRAIHVTVHHHKARQGKARQGNDQTGFWCLSQLPKLRYVSVAGQQLTDNGWLHDENTKSLLSCLAWLGLAWPSLECEREKKQHGTKGGIKNKRCNKYKFGLTVNTAPPPPAAAASTRAFLTYGIIHETISLLASFSTLYFFFFFFFLLL